MYYNFLALAGRFLPDNAVFAEALHAMDEGLDGLEATVAEHQRQAELVELQAQFMGYVDMYAPSRRLVREVSCGLRGKAQDILAHLLRCQYCQAPASSDGAVLDTWGPQI